MPMEFSKPRLSAVSSPEDRDRRREQWRSYLSMLRAASAAWSAHRASSMGASLAFYASFSLAPMFVIVIAIAGMVFGEDAARGEVVEQLRDLIGPSGALAVQGLIEGARNIGQGFLASLIAFAALLLAATKAFAELKDSLDVIWGSERAAPSNILNLLRGRLLSFGLILTLGFLLLVSLLISASLAALQKYWGAWFSDVAWITEGVNSMVSFLVVTALFAIIYKWLPDASIAWRDVGIGALVTASLFTLGKFLIGFYIGNSAIASSFGAAGSLVVILLWVYYSSQIFFFGAEFTRVYAERRGSRSA